MALLLHLTVCQCGFSSEMQQPDDLFPHLCCASSACVLPLAQVEDIQPEAVQYVLLDLPGLLFFTTYTLLVLFWAEIYHQARPVNHAS